MSNYLNVGLGAEPMTCREEFLSKIPGIINFSITDSGDCLILIVHRLKSGF